MIRTNKKLLAYCLLIIITLLTSSCATIDGPPNPDDPFERFNRTVFSYNEFADKNVLKPVAKAYDFVMPSFANKAVSNFFNNLDDITVIFNQLLQFKFNKAALTSARFVYNSTIGLAGLIDVAKHMDIPKQKEDFGQTLAVWGVDSGPYIVLPVLGPATVRSTVGLIGDKFTYNPVYKKQNQGERLITSAIEVIDMRAGLLKAGNIIDKIAPDKYAFMRDAWLERRNYLIYDGNPPDDFDIEELFEDEDLFNIEPLSVKL